MHPQGKADEAVTAAFLAVEIGARLPVKLSGTGSNNPE